ncbi:MAG: hypothetical protein ACKVN9_07305 [Methylophilaceae bacterium]
MNEEIKHVTLQAPILKFAAKKEFFSLIMIVIISLFPVASNGGEDESDRYISCIIDKDSMTSELDPLQDLFIFGMFEGLRKRDSQKLTQESWGSHFLEFSNDFKAAHAKKWTIRSQELRNQLKEKFSVADLSEVCKIFEAPYFVELQEKQAKNSNAFRAYLNAKATGQLVSEAEKENLLAQAKATEQNLRSFKDTNKERVSKFASSSLAFRQYLTVYISLIKSSGTTNNDSEMKEFFDKWENFGKSEEPSGQRGRYRLSRQPNYA